MSDSSGAVRRYLIGLATIPASTAIASTAVWISSGIESWGEAGHWAVEMITAAATIPIWLIGLGCLAASFLMSIATAVQLGDATSEDAMRMLATALSLVVVAVVWLASFAAFT